MNNKEIEIKKIVKLPKKINELPYGANGIGYDGSLLILRPDNKGCDVLKKSFDKKTYLPV